MARSNRFAIDYGDITVIDYLVLRRLWGHNIVNVKTLLDESDDPEQTLKILKKLDAARLAYMDNGQVAIASRGERAVGWVRKVIGITGL